MIETHTGVSYYYDRHPTPKDLMGENELQENLLSYLMLVLRYQFRAEGWYLARDLNIYQSDIAGEVPVAPDIAAFIGVARADLPDDYVRSWRIRSPLYPPPVVVFEVASDGTWRTNLREKPGIYGAMGVEEYYLYDPRPRPQIGPHRLRAWRYERPGSSTSQGIVAPTEALRDERGWIWSPGLQSWLVPDDRLLRVHDISGHRRLTGEESERQARERAYERLREIGIDPESL